LDTDLNPDLDKWCSVNEAYDSNLHSRVRVLLLHMRCLPIRLCAA
jgi:hypothetical protein